MEMRTAKEVLLELGLPADSESANQEYPAEGTVQLSAGEQLVLWDWFRATLVKGSKVRRLAAEAEQAIVEDLAAQQAEGWFVQAAHAAALEKLAAKSRDDPAK